VSFTHFYGSAQGESTEPARRRPTFRFEMSA
jgi:hypothetical protein